METITWLIKHTAFISHKKTFWTLKKNTHSCAADCTFFSLVLHLSILQPTYLNGLVFHSVGKGRISCCSFYLLNEIEYRCGYYIVTTQLVAVESEMQGEDFVNNDPFWVCLRLTTSEQMKSGCAALIVLVGQHRMHSMSSWFTSAKGAASVCTV